MLCVFGVLTKYDVHSHIYAIVAVAIFSLSILFDSVLSSKPTGEPNCLYLWMWENSAQKYTTHGLNRSRMYFMTCADLIFSISIALISTAQFNMLNFVNVRFVLFALF